MPEDRIYLDHQATTPVDERVLDAMLPYFTQTYGNAASNDHLFGVESKRGVDEARSKIEGDWREAKRDHLCQRGHGVRQHGALRRGPALRGRGQPHHHLPN